MNLIRARDVMGLPVVSIRSGEDVAEVRDVVSDREAHRLLGFTLRRRGMFAGRLKSVLSTTSVAAIGPDAVMIDHDAAIDDRGDRPIGLGENPVVPAEATPFVRNDLVGFGVATASYRPASLEEDQ